MRAEAKPRVLCVDDEPHVLESLRDSLRRHFDVLTTTNGFEALRLLTDHPCAVVVSDMRMPMLAGGRFLPLASQHAPDTVRVVLTGQATSGDMAAAVNDGGIFRLLIKPCPRPELVAALDAAVEHHGELVRRREHDESTARATARTLLAVGAAIDPDAPARAARLHQAAGELASRASGVRLGLELELACEAMHAGAIALPPDVRGRLAAGRRIAREDAAELERLPQLALPFVREHPALTSVAALLESASRPYRAPASRTAPTPPAAAVLRIVLDYEILERQEAPMETALRALEDRSGRYSPELLATFAELIRYG